MNHLYQAPCRWRWIAWTALLAVSLGGCGASSPKTYPVKGKLVFKGDDIKRFIGGTIEFVLKDDPNVRAAGVIEEDGTFSLNTYHDGKKLKGAVPGHYQILVHPPGWGSPLGSADATALYNVKPGDNEFTIQLAKRR